MKFVFTGKDAKEQLLAVLERAKTRKLALPWKVEVVGTGGESYGFKVEIELVRPDEIVFLIESLRQMVTDSIKVLTIELDGASEKSRTVKKVHDEVDEEYRKKAAKCFRMLRSRYPSLNRTALAQSVGIAVSAFYVILRGERRLSAGNAVKMIRALNLTNDDPLAKGLMELVEVK